MLNQKRKKKKKNTKKMKEGLILFGQTDLLNLYVVPLIQNIQESPIKTKRTSC
jgi:hypothetical protein